jgi:hypothetical protein
MSADMNEALLEQIAFEYMVPKVFIVRGGVMLFMVLANTKNQIFFAIYPEA